jgi:hypothetical protein
LSAFLNVQLSRPYSTAGNTIVCPNLTLCWSNLSSVR